MASMSGRPMARPGLVGITTFTPPLMKPAVTRVGNKAESGVSAALARR
jgi:hypothetical protein